MPVQPHLFPDSPSSPTEQSPAPPPMPPDAASDAASDSDIAPAPLWLQRMSLFVLVLFCIYLGVILVVMPWWPNLWDRNLFLQSHPGLWSILRLGPVRGFISGLGLLDIWIGVSEAVHYRDHRA